MMKHEYDPRGLIRESYRIEGISAPECRSIFLDWVLGAAATPPVREQIQTLLDFYSDQPADHPMSVVLRDGLAQHDATPTRRGGRRGRVS